MIEPDTIKLLRECDAGIKMGVESIGSVIDSIQAEAFKKCLRSCLEKHMRLQEEIQKLLAQYEDEGKEPAPLAKGMSAIKTNVKLAMDESDETIAELMTDGCNMGIKSLSRYLNQYEAASEQVKDITKKLLEQEEELVRQIRCFL